MAVPRSPGGCHDTYLQLGQTGTPVRAASPTSLRFEFVMHVTHTQLGAEG